MKAALNRWDFRTDLKLSRDDAKGIWWIESPLMVNIYWCNQKGFTIEIVFMPQNILCNNTVQQLQSHMPFDHILNKAVQALK